MLCGMHRIGLRLDAELLARIEKARGNEKREPFLRRTLDEIIPTQIIRSANGEVEVKFRKALSEERGDYIQDLVDYIAEAGNLQGFANQHGSSLAGGPVPEGSSELITIQSDGGVIKAAVLDLAALAAAQRGASDE